MEQLKTDRGDHVRRNLIIRKMIVQTVVCLDVQRGKRVLPFLKFIRLSPFI